MLDGDQSVQHPSFAAVSPRFIELCRRIPSPVPFGPYIRVRPPTWPYDPRALPLAARAFPGRPLDQLTSTFGPLEQRGFGLLSILDCIKVISMSPKGNPREKGFRLVLDDDEHHALMTMAADDGVSAAAWLRQRIRREWSERSQRKPARGIRKR